MGHGVSLGGGNGTVYRWLNLQFAGGPAVY